MSTVLDELLVMVGVEVDQGSVRKAADSVKNDLVQTRKSTLEHDKANGVVWHYAEGLEEVNDQLDGKKKQGSDDKKDDESRIKRLKELGATLKGAKQLLGGITKGFVAAGAGATYYTLRMAKTDDAQMKMARATGISAGELDKWERLAIRNGSSAEAMRASLVGLSGAIGATRFGQYNQGFAMMGINVNKANGELKSNIEVMREIADAIQGMPEAEQMSLAQMAGISADLLPVLQQGRYAIDEFLNDTTTAMDATRIASENLNDSVSNVGDAFKKFTEPARLRWLDGANNLLGNITDNINQATKEGFWSTYKSQFRDVYSAPGRDLARQYGEMKASNNVTINVNGGDLDKVRRVAEEAVSGQLRTSMNNADGQDDI